MFGLLIFAVIIRLLLLLH